MPAMPTSEIVVLALILLGFAAFAVTLLTVSLAVTFARKPEGAQGPSREVTPAKRVS